MFKKYLDFYNWCFSLVTQVHDCCIFPFDVNTVPVSKTHIILSELMPSVWLGSEYNYGPQRLKTRAYLVSWMPYILRMNSFWWSFSVCIFHSRGCMFWAHEFSLSLSPLHPSLPRFLSFSPLRSERVWKPLVIPVPVRFVTFCPCAICNTEYENSGYLLPLKGKRAVDSKYAHVGSLTKRHVPSEYSPLETYRCRSSWSKCTEWFREPESARQTSK